MCDTGQQVTQSAFVDHKFQRLGLRASGFLNSNNEAIVYTACFLLDTLRKMYLFNKVLYVIVLHVLFHVFCFLEFYLKIIHLHLAVDVCVVSTAPCWWNTIMTWIHKSQYCSGAHVSKML